MYYSAITHVLDRLTERFLEVLRRPKYDDPTYLDQRRAEVFSRDKTVIITASAIHK